MVVNSSSHLAVATPVEGAYFCVRVVDDARPARVVLSPPAHLHLALVRAHRRRFAIHLLQHCAHLACRGRVLERALRETHGEVRLAHWHTRSGKTREEGWMGVGGETSCLLPCYLNEIWRAAASPRRPPRTSRLACPSSRFPLPCHRGQSSLYRCWLLHENSAAELFWAGASRPQSLDTKRVSLSVISPSGCQYQGISPAVIAPVCASQVPTRAGLLSPLQAPSRRVRP